MAVKLIGEPKKRLALNKVLKPEQVNAIASITGKHGCYNIDANQENPTVTYDVVFHDRIMKKLNEWGIITKEIAAA